MSPAEFGWARISEVNCGAAGRLRSDIYDFLGRDVWRSRWKVEFFFQLSDMVLGSQLGLLMRL
jgi:hypothetical protein